MHKKKMINKIFAIGAGLVLLAGIAGVPSTTLAFPCYANDGTNAYVGESPCSSGSSAEGSGNGGEKITTFGGLLDALNGLMNAIVPFLVGLGVFVVIYGVFGYIAHSAEEEKRAEARQFILWGVIFIFLMLSIWGLVNILVNTFEFKRNAPTVESVFPA